MKSNKKIVEYQMENKQLKSNRIDFSSKLSFADWNLGSPGWRLARSCSWIIAAGVRVASGWIVWAMGVAAGGIVWAVAWWAIGRTCCLVMSAFSFKSLLTSKLNSAYKHRASRRTIIIVVKAFIDYEFADLSYYLFCPWRNVRCFGFRSNLSFLEVFMNFSRSFNEVLQFFFLLFFLWRLIKRICAFQLFYSKLNFFICMDKLSNTLRLQEGSP